MKSLGRQVKTLTKIFGKNIVFKFINVIVMQKFSQNQHFSVNILISTGNKILVEASPSDKIWGIGLSVHSKKAHLWKMEGLNLLGQILTEIKFQFMTE